MVKVLYQDTGHICGYAVDFLAACQAVRFAADHGERITFSDAENINGMDINGLSYRGQKFKFVALGNAHGKGFCLACLTSSG